MRIHLAALAATLTMSAMSAPPALAAVTQPPHGWRCATTDDVEPVTNQVFFDAGPFVLADEDDPSVEHTGTVTCSIVDKTTPTHAGATLATVTSAVGTRVVYLPPTGTGVAADDLPYEYHICTRLDIDGTTLYWHDHPDRNTDGYWTPSQSARCANTSETADARGEDARSRYALDVLFTAAAESDPLTPVTDVAVCAVPEQYRDLVGACGAPALTTSVSIVRTAAAGAIVRRVPYGWTCTDEQSLLPVAAGSPLTVPNPAVSCVPPATVSLSCAWVQVSGVLAPTTFGRVAISTGCGAKAVTRWLSAGNGQLAEWRSGTYQAPGVPPWRCAATESTPADPTYLLECNVVAWFA